MGATDVKETMMDYEDQMAMVGKLSGVDLQNLHILVEQASYELRQHKPEQALTYLMTGLRRDKSCIEMLELKGKCYIEMNRYREALASADEILIGQKEKNNSTALAVKASALYNLGDFEHALLSFHRYYKNVSVGFSYLTTRYLRYEYLGLLILGINGTTFTFRALKTSNCRDRLTLLEGIKLAELGVMNAVGSTTVQYFRNLDSIINMMPINIMNMSWYKLKNYMDTKEDKLMKRKKDRKFLEALASDKQYLEGIIKKIALPSSKSSTKDANSILATQSILIEAENALGFLQDRREFWSQQKPDYPSGPKEKAESAPKWTTLQQRVVNKPPSTFKC